MGQPATPERCELCEQRTPEKVGYGCVRCVGRLFWAEDLVRPGGVKSHLSHAKAEAWCFDRHGDAFALRHGSYLGRRGHARHKVDVEIAHNAVSRAHARVFRDAEARWRAATAADQATLVVDDSVATGVEGVALREGAVLRFSGVAELRFSARPKLPGKHHPRPADLGTNVPAAKFSVCRGAIELRIAQVSSGQPRSKYTVARGDAEVVLPERLGPLLWELLNARARGETQPLEREAVARRAEMNKQYLAVCKRDLRTALRGLGLGEDDFVRRDELRLAPQWRVTRG